MFCNMEGEACTNFVDSKAIDGRCRFIEKTDQSLVRGSPSSKKSLKVWTKETIETGFVFNNFNIWSMKCIQNIFIAVPHFLILHEDNIIQDYTLDEDKSPQMTSYPEFPFSGLGTCGVLNPSTMKLIMRNKVQLWTFI